MNVILVGRVRDKRVVRWGNVAMLTIALAVVLGSGMALMYWLLSGRWSALVALLGIFGAVIVVGTGVMRGLQTPPDRLCDAR